MKKLLSLLSVLTISGTAIPTTIAASSYQKQETIKNSDINYQQTNNLEKLKRNKRKTHQYPTPENAHLYREMAINNWGYTPQQADEWVNSQINYMQSNNFGAVVYRTVSSINERAENINLKNAGVSAGAGCVGGAVAGAPGGPGGAAFGCLGGAVTGVSTSVGIVIWLRIPSNQHINNRNEVNNNINNQRIIINRIIEEVLEVINYFINLNKIY